MILPRLATRGIFEFKDPFSSLIESQDLELTVVAIRLLPDLVTSEEDPFNSIYMASGLTNEDYDNDLRENVPIVTFATDEGKYIYVPANRIEKYPDIEGYLYQEYFLAAYLPIMKAGTDFSTLIEEVQETITSYLGVRCKVIVHYASDTILLNNEEHRTIEERLKSSLDYKKTYRYQYGQLLNQFEEIKKQNEILKKALAKIPKEIKYI